MHYTERRVYTICLKSFGGRFVFDSKKKSEFERSWFPRQTCPEDLHYTDCFASYLMAYQPSRVNAKSIILEGQ